MNKTNLYFAIDRAINQHGINDIIMHKNEGLEFNNEKVFGFMVKKPFNSRIFDNIFNIVDYDKYKCSNYYQIIDIQDGELVYNNIIGIKFNDLKEEPIIKLTELYNILKKFNICCSEVDSYNVYTSFNLIYEDDYYSIDIIKTLKHYDMNKLNYLDDDLYYSYYDKNNKIINDKITKILKQNQ